MTPEKWDGTKWVRETFGGLGEPPDGQRDARDVFLSCCVANREGLVVGRKGCAGGVRLSMGRYDEFEAFRAKLNERIMGDDAARGTHADGTPRCGGTLVTKRFFQLDTKAYQGGALDEKTKELLGLAASMVLRCDDCIAYHIDQCIRAGASDEELWETFDIALIVGGSIVIPHLRRGVDFLDACRANA